MYLPTTASSVSRFLGQQARAKGTYTVTRRDDGAVRVSLNVPHPASLVVLRTVLARGGYSAALEENCVVVTGRLSRKDRIAQAVRNSR